MNLEKSDDHERRGGWNYVNDVIPSDALLHHATGRDPRRKVRLLQRAAGRTELVSLAGEREARVIERRLLENVQMHYEAHVAQRVSLSQVGSARPSRA